jgi:hypothetical protein
MRIASFGQFRAAMALIAALTAKPRELIVGSRDRDLLERTIAPPLPVFGKMRWTNGNPGFAPSRPGKTGAAGVKRSALRHRNRLRAKGQHRKAAR